MHTESEISDLINKCETEPIHIPGCIQPHGILMTLRSSDLTILQISESVYDLTGIHHSELLHQPLSRLMPIEPVERATKKLGDRVPRLLNPIPIELIVRGIPTFFDGILHRSGRVLILELEKHVAKDRGYGGFGGFYEAIREVTSKMMITENLSEVLELACQELRKLTGFARVLVYRFDADWNGEVINESKEDEVSTLLHHRFPASDIPRQARDLYTTNWLRLIPSVDYIPAQITPLINPITDKPLDMSNSVLRSVSPVHLEYMRNMGQAASMSVSLLKGKQLWGLISCHNPEPLYLKYDVRVAAEFIGQMVSAQIIAREESAEIDHKLQLKKLYDDLLRYGGGYSSIRRSFSVNPTSLLGLVDAQGAALCLNGKISVIGSTPPLEQIETIYKWIVEKDESLFSTHNLTAIPGALTEVSDLSTGILSILMKRETADAIIWFRPELRSQTKWAGNPTETKIVKDGKIHPRKSFETWYENSSGKSKKWKQAEVDAADELRIALLGMAAGHELDRAMDDGGVNFKDSLTNSLEISSLRNRLQTGETQNLGNRDFVKDDRLLLEGFSEFAVLLLDIKGRVQNWSSGARRLLGYEPPDVLGKSLDLLFAEEEALVRKLDLFLEQVRTSGKADGELWLYRADGSSFWGKIWLASVRDQKAKPIGFSVIVQDITKERSAEEELRAMKVTAEAASQSKTAFLANISHEIRTPLGAVLGFSELMSSPNLPDEEKFELYDKVRRNGEQLTILINDLLDISKVESGKIEIERIPTDFESILFDCEQLLKLKASEKGLTLEIEIVGSLPKIISIDPTRLRQIIVNLLSNSIKFTPSGGSIRLKVSMERNLNRNLILIRVIDSGRGMSEREMERLFKPFVQADVSTTREYGGTGLGLFLSQRLARALDGDLSIEWSAPGKGSCFVCSFDPGEVSVDSTFSTVENRNVKSKRGSAESSDLEGYKILVVDDAVDNRDLLKIYLEKAGAKIESAENGLHGCEMAMRADYDIILMDIQMPVLDGNAAMKLLVSKNYQKPVIALTAHAMKEEREQAFASGFTDYLTKPINRKLLIATVIKAVGETKARGET